MNLTSPKLARNYIYLLIGELISKIATFAALAYLARLLGPSQYGSFEFAASLIFCAGLIVDQGFNLYGAREIAQSPEKTQKLASEIVWVRLLLAILAYMCVLAFATFSKTWQDDRLLILIYGLSIFGLPLILHWVFQGHNRMGVVAVLQITRQLTFAGVIFLLARAGAQTHLVGIAEGLGVLLAGIIGVWLVRRDYNWKLSARPVFTRRLFSEGIPIGLSQAFWVVRMFGATVLIGLVATPADLGYFGAAMRILIAAHSIVYLYFFNLFPSLSTAWERGDGSFSRLSSLSLHLVSWGSILIGSIAIVLSPYFMTTLYGSSFSPGGSAMQWLVGVLTIAAISGHYRFGLVASGNQNKEMISSALGAITTLVFLPIAYSQWGIKGAAAGLLAAEIIVWITSWWWSSRLSGISGHAMILVKPGLTFFIVMLIMRIFSTISPFLQATIAGILTLCVAVITDPVIRAQLSRVPLVSRSIVTPGR
jgi:O-antigen/teichoic acid export membrane protein